MAMRYRSRVLVAAAALGFASALALMLVTFVVSMKFGEFAQWFRAPGEWLVLLSDQVCPPKGAECFLGSSRRGAQHLWLILCALAAWSLIFSAAWWGGYRLVERARTRAWTERRPLFLHKKRGMS
jgi:hypothetical protein